MKHSITHLILGLLFTASLSTHSLADANPDSERANKRQQRMAQMADELGLTDEQRSQMKAIKEKHRAQIKAIKKESREKIKAERESMKAELSKILTADQMTQLEAKQAERQAKRKEKKKESRQSKQ